MKTEKKKIKPVLTVFSLVMINVIAIDSLRNLPMTAQYGFSLVFFYLLAAVLFFLPTLLIIAELATGWPKTGGLYVWVKQAFGPRCGFFAIWLQWIYNVIWYPTILVFLVGTFAYVADPVFFADKVHLFFIVVGLFWLVTILNFFGMKVSALVSTIGTLLGTLLPMLLIILLAALWLFQGKPAQVDFSLHSLLPHGNEWGNISFMIIILFSLIGLEMSAVHAGEVKNPERNYPRALIYSAIIIVVGSLLSALAIAIVVPHQQLSIISGLMNGFKLFFHPYGLDWLLPVIVILIILGGLCMVSAWIIGPSKSLMVAGRDGVLPKFFSKTNRYQVPVNILLLQAVIVTAISSLFLFMPSINSSYWILSDMTAQYALIVYLFMYAAAIYLRYKYPRKEKQFQIPGGKLGLIFVAGLGIFSCLAAVVIGFIPPASVAVGGHFVYEGILVAGMFLMFLPPLLIIFVMKRKSGVKE